MKVTTIKGDNNIPCGLGSPRPLHTWIFARTHGLSIQLYLQLRLIILGSKDTADHKGF